MALTSSLKIIPQTIKAAACPSLSVVTPRASENSTSAPTMRQSISSVSETVGAKVCPVP